MYRCCVIAAVLALGLTTSVALARPGVVKTTDGRTVEGDVTERPDGSVEVVAHNVTMSFKRDQVASIQQTGDIQEQYKDRLAKLPADAGAPAHLELARWLFSNGQYELARTEAETAVRLDPRNPDARPLLDTIRRQEMMEHNRTATTTPAAGTTGPKAVQPIARKLLTADQILAVRQAELVKNDSQVRIQFTNNVQKRFLDYYAKIDTVDFNSRNDFDKAVLILQEGQAGMAKDVKIVSDPGAIAGWKKVQATVIQGCAAASCHGETGKSNLVLFTSTDSDTSYTNFYILARFAPRIGGVEHRLIDRTRPADSLVLQYGLPRDALTKDVQFPHPDVQGWKPIFTGLRDPKYTAFYNWIDLGLRKIEPDYQIDYVLPTGKPTTQPATLPVTVPSPQ